MAETVGRREDEVSELCQAKERFVSRSVYAIDRRPHRSGYDEEGGGKAGGEDKISLGQAPQGGT